MRLTKEQIAKVDSAILDLLESRRDSTDYIAANMRIKTIDEFICDKLIELDPYYEDKKFRMILWNSRIIALHKKGLLVKTQKYTNIRFRAANPVEIAAAKLDKIKKRDTIKVKE